MEKSKIKNTQVVDHIKKHNKIYKLLYYVDVLYINLKYKYNRYSKIPRKIETIQILNILISQTNTEVQNDDMPLLLKNIYLIISYLF